MKKEHKTSNNNKEVNNDKKFYKNFKQASLLIEEGLKDFCLDKTKRCENEFYVNNKIENILLGLEEVLTYLSDKDDYLNPFFLANACVNGNLNKVKRYIAQEGRSVNDKIPFKAETPLMLAIANEQWEVVRFLINNGADLLAVDGDGNTPLNVSVSADINTPEDIIKALINSETLNKCDCFEQTPLYKAIMTDKPAAVKMLLEAGADCSSKFFNGLTPMMLALKIGHIECARELQKLGYELELPPERLDTFDDELEDVDDEQVEAVDVEEKREQE